MQGGEEEGLRVEPPGSYKTTGNIEFLKLNSGIQVLVFKLNTYTLSGAWYSQLKVFIYKKSRIQLTRTVITAN